MTRFIVFLIFLGICLGTGYAINHIPYEIYIKTPTEFTRTSLIVALILALAAALILIYLFKILIFFLSSPRIFSRNARVRKRAKADRLLKTGLAELLAGHYSRAERSLEYGGRLAESLGLDAVIFYENAAIAADRQQASERRDYYLLRARQDASQKQTPLTRLAEAELRVKNKEYKQAVKLLEKLHESEPRNFKITLLLDDTYSALEQWKKAWQLLPELRRQLSKSDYEARKKRYAKGMLNDTAALESVAELEAAWKKLPTDIRKDNEMILQYAGILVDNEHSAAAEKFLADEIKNTQNLELIQAYSQLHSADFHAQLANMQAWEAKHLNDAIFLYAKALIAYKAREFDTALQAIEISVKRNPTHEGFILYAQILEAKNQPEAALEAYRNSVYPAYPELAFAGSLLPAPEEEKEGQGNENDSPQIAADKS